MQARWMSDNQPSVPIFLATAFFARNWRCLSKTISRRSYIDQALFPDGARVGSLAGIVGRSRSSRGDVAGEDIADAPHALDDPLLVRWPLELAPEASHVSVERAIERRPVAPLDHPREFVTGEHPPRVLHEQAQQSEFRVCQINQVSVARPQFALDEVENAVVEGANARTQAAPAAFGLDERRFVTPEHILYSQHRLSRIERLDDVIVSAMLKPDDPGDFTVPPSNHNERHIANRSHFPRQLQPVSV